MSDEPSKPRVPLVPRAPEPVAMQHGRPILTEIPRTPTPLPPKPLPKTAKAVSAVMSEIGTIGKGGRNDFHGYNYARMSEDLLHVLTPLLGKHGIFYTQNLVNYAMVEQNRVACDFEFQVYVDDEVSPTIKFTGMSMLRDKKGNIDDKAMLKAHTQARKYFLLGLFNVPAGDMPDNDQDDDKPPAPVPGPAPGPTKEPERTSTGPHRIALGKGATPEQFASAFIQRIGTATTAEEVAAWDRENDAILQALSDRHSAIYERVRMATERRLTDLAKPVPDTAANGMPDPKADVGIAVNWVAQQLNDFVEYQAAETFWNTVVAPREADFGPIEFEILLAEWRRTDARLSPAVDDDGVIA